MQSLKISLYEILLCLSNAQDLALPELSKHHQQVASLSLRLAREAGLPLEEQKEILIAALIHDIGALSMRERLEIIEGNVFNLHTHAVRGANLLEGFAPLYGPAGLIRHHHVPWAGGQGVEHRGREVRQGSHILHLADRICIQMKSGSNILSQVPDIISYVREQSGKLFQPELAELLLYAGRKEDLWLEISARQSSSPWQHNRTADYQQLDVEDLVELASIFSHIIDFRSKFTAKHSAGVAKTAERLASIVGFSPMECRLMLVAGYLHDLGKLAISDGVLEKPAKLTTDEYNEIRAHTYFTYRLLEPITELRLLNEWASFHHEKLNGKGYPFKIAGDNISLGSRVMAVADVFTAVVENRPYRKPMTKEQVISVLRKMVEEDGLDGRVVGEVMDHYDELRDVCQHEQDEAEKRYRAFLEQS